MKTFIMMIIFIYQLYPAPLKGQPLQGETTARNAALGSTGLFSTDAFTGNQNQANLAYLTRPEIGLHSSSHFFIPGLQTNIIGGAFPLAYGTPAITLSYTGVPKFHEIKTGFGFGKKISAKASAGIQLNYFNRYVAEHGYKQHLLSGEGGIHCHLSKKISVAGHVFNPLQLFKSPEQAWFNFSSIKLGGNYKPDTSLSLLLEAEQNTSRAFLLKTGLEWEAAPQFYLRTGYQVPSGIWGIGTGFPLADFKADLSVTLHPFLGISTHFSVIYAFKNTVSAYL